MLTIEEVIIALEQGPRTIAREQAIPYLKEYLDIQDEYYKLKDWWAEEHAENNPLTWDELKTMSGKPVLVEWISGIWKGLNKWVILSRIDDDYLVFAASDVAGQSYNGLLRLMNLGKLWQAYRKERE